VQVEDIQEYQPLTSPDLESLRVMVVDDEAMVRETLQLFFHNLGVVYVDVVESGEKAVLEIEKTRFDYIFMDLMMPGMNGIETLKQIKEVHQLTNVIIMTGFPSMENVIEAMRNGAADFLVKPFRFQDIKIILERIHRIRILMERNWTLHQELKGKKEVEELNKELEKKIRLQTTMYNIVDSLSRINRAEDLYKYLVKKSIEYCNARKACFLIYEDGDSNLLVLSHQGIKDINPGTVTRLKPGREGKQILDNHFLRTHFSKSFEHGFPLDTAGRNNGFMSIPFNIRNEPFGILLVAEKAGEQSFDEEDEFILKFLIERTALNIENIALYDNLMQSLMASLMSLVSAIEAKDPYTQQHSTRVTRYSVKIARAMGCSDEDIKRIESIGPLHDIGKIGVHDSILNKPGRLTKEEFEEIKAHPLIGVNIVSPLGLEPVEQAIIRNHHERWDGKGYPDGLKGEEIPVLSRILFVADAFDAMNSSRAYRKALPHSTCIQELKNNSGTQFDPEVVEAALSVFRT
jgi:putative nucleotidyltransferase with HDIG domain